MYFQERHWGSPGMAAALQAAINTPQSYRLKEALNITPRLLDVYFAIGLRDMNDCMLLSDLIFISYTAYLFFNDNYSL